MAKDLEKTVELGLLYDFYGELLTPHQRGIYEAAYFEDLSLSEIADDEGISRQGVHDLIKRCNKALLEYESKLHLVERFKNTRNKVEDIERLVKDYRDNQNPEIIEEIERISTEILEEL